MWTLYVKTFRCPFYECLKIKRMYQKDLPTFVFVTDGCLSWTKTNLHSSIGNNIFLLLNNHNRMSDTNDLYFFNTNLVLNWNIKLTRSYKCHAHFARYTGLNQKHFTDTVVELSCSQVVEANMFVSNKHNGVPCLHFCLADFNAETFFVWVICLVCK